MMDISVLDEAEIDNSSAVDCGEDYSPDNILDSLSDNKDNVEAEMKELPDQLTENEVSEHRSLQFFRRYLIGMWAHEEGISVQ